jgi:hypothetical protein
VTAGLVTEETQSFHKCMMDIGFHPLLGTDEASGDVI